VPLDRVRRGPARRLPRLASAHRDLQGRGTARPRPAAVDTQRLEQVAEPQLDDPSPRASALTRSAAPRRRSPRRRLDDEPGSRRCGRSSPRARSPARASADGGRSALRPGTPGVGRFDHVQRRGPVTAARIRIESGASRAVHPGTSTTWSARPAGLRPCCEEGRRWCAAGLVLARLLDARPPGRTRAQSRRGGPPPSRMSSGREGGTKSFAPRINSLTSDSPLPSRQSPLESPRARSRARPIGSRW
jgi:hypothetical protein